MENLLILFAVLIVIGMIAYDIYKEKTRKWGENR